MAKMFYDFETRQQVNPLDNVKSFIIDPRNPDNYKLLNIEEKITNLDETTVAFWKGMPTLLLPIEALDLGVAQVHFNDDFSGKIISRGSKVTTTIYFQPTENESIIRITTVLCG